jgi:hypothetical protein
MAAERAGCERWARRAASVKVPWSAIRRKWRSSSIINNPDDYHINIP